MKTKIYHLVIPLSGLKFASAEGTDKKTSDIQVCMVGSWEHDWYGKVEFTKANLSEMVKNFDAGARDVPIDYNHASLSPDPEAAKAAGWVKKLFTKERGTQLWATVEWTDKAVEYITAGEYRYISPELNVDARDKVTDEKIGAVLYAAALTNRPFLEGMAPVELSEASMYTTTVFTKSPARGAQSTPPKGGRSMNEKRIRELLSLSDDVQITDEHRNLAFAALDAKLAETAGQVQTLTAAQAGTVRLSEAEVVTLRTQAAQGSDALKQLTEMRVGTALTEAQRAGKVAGKDTALYREVEKTLRLNYDSGAALIDALPKVISFSVHGSDGGAGANGQDEVQAFIESRTAGAGAVTFSQATDEAYKKFTKDQMDAWRFKKVV